MSLKDSIKELNDALSEGEPSPLSSRSFIEKLIPESVILLYNKLLYKYDSKLYKIEKLYRILLSYISLLFSFNWAHRIKHRLGVFRSYLHVLSNDYDYDWGYLLVILRTKLDRMEKSLRNGYLISSEDSADQIKICLYYLDSLIEESYTSKLYEELATIYPGADYHKLIRHVFLDEKGRRRIKYKLTRFEAIDEASYHKDFTRLNRYYSRLRQAEWDVVCHILRNNLFTWWD